MYDEDEFDDTASVPTIREALRSLRAATAEPFRSRHKRARLWAGRIRGMEIDWNGFAVTRGGFFEWLMPLAYVEWPDGRPPERVPMLVAAVGYCAPMASYCGESGWVPWGHWYCWRHMPAPFPALSVARGSIQFLAR